MRKHIVENLHIRHFHIPHNAPYLPLKILHNRCIFSWVLKPSQEKLKTMLIQNSGGKIRCIMGNVEVAYKRKSMQIKKGKVFHRWHFHLGKVVNPYSVESPLSCNGCPKVHAFHYLAFGKEKRLCHAQGAHGLLLASTALQIAQAFLPKALVGRGDANVGN